MKTKKAKMCRWVLAMVLGLLPVSLMAQTSNNTRERVVLHKEVFYDIRIMESNQASRIAQEVAEFMKTHEDVSITVTGYADRGTGTPALNVKYARGRAENFRRDLVLRFNVDPNRISVDSKGDLVQPFAENARNRCVIVDGYGYVPAPKVEHAVQTAAAIATAQRQEFMDTKAAQYSKEMNKNRDTIVISHVDTLWLVPAQDTLREERPFGLNRANRWNNWFVTLSGGPAIFQGDHNIDAVWADRIYPAFDFSIGKYLVPCIALRAGVNLDVIHSYYNANPDYPNELASKYGEFVHGASIDSPYGKRPWLYRMDYSTWNFHTDVMINFSSFMWRPYSRRIWNLIGYAGIGCIATWDNGDFDWFNYATSWNVGIMNSFRVMESLDINIDLRVKKFNDDFNCFRQGRDMDGATNLMIGFTWYFTKRGF